MFTRIHKSASVLVLLLCAISSLTAQNARWEARQWLLFLDQHRSNFAITGGIATATILTDVSAPLLSRLGIGSRLDLGYTYFWRHDCGFRTGLGLAYCYNVARYDRIESSSTGSISAYNNTSRTVRSSHFTTTTIDVDEHYNTIYLQIPALVVLQDQHFHFGAGLRFMLPIRIGASFAHGPTTMGVGYAIDGFGQHVDIPIETLNAAAQEGDYTIAALSDERLCFPFVVALALDCGYHWQLDRKHQMSISAYVNYGLNRTSVGDSEPLVILENGVLRTRNCMQSNLIHHLRYLDIGVSLTYNITFGKPIGYTKNKPFKQHKRNRRYRL